MNQKQNRGIYVFLLFDVSFELLDFLAGIACRGLLRTKLAESVVFPLDLRFDVVQDGLEQHVFGSSTNAVRGVFEC